MKTFFLILLAATIAIAAAPSAQSHRLTLWVATVVCDDNGTFQFFSFADAEPTKDQVAANLATFLAAKYPGARLVSSPIEPVDEAVVQKMVQDRARRAAF